MILIIALFFGITAAHADEGTNLLVLEPQVGYHSPRIFTQGQNANYHGKNFGGSIYYRIGSETFAIAPYATYSLGKFENEANSSTRTETIDEKTLSVGLKVYFGPLFVKGGYSRVNFESTATGVAAQSISDSATGPNGGIGLAWSLSRFIRVELAGEVLNANFSPNAQGFSAKAQYLRLGGTLGIGIVLPSGPSKKSTFKFSDSK